MSAAPRLLAGIRVVDFTWIVAGPLCTKWLAAWGAEVIRVESPRSRRDVGRSGGFSGLFFNNNTDKLSVSLDMQHPQSAEIVKRLVAVSDVVINNFTPDVLPRWGLGYEELVKVNPEVIAVSMPAMGSTGPRRHYKGTGNYFTSLAGFDSMVGYPGAEEVDVLNWATSDSGPNPFQAATAIMAALHYRSRTGFGQAIEVRQHEAVVNFMGSVFMDQTINGPSEVRTGSRSPAGAPHGVYRCAGDDRWCAISVLNDAQWQGFCGAAGLDSLVDDPRFATLLARKASEDELDRLVTGWTSCLPPETVMHRLQQVGVPAGVVQNVRDLLEGDPHLAARGFYTWLDRPDGGGRFPVEGVAPRFSAVPTGVQRPAPVLGQDNDYVLQHLLGLSEEAVNQFIIEGVLRS